MGRLLVMFVLMAFGPNAFADSREDRLVREAFHFAYPLTETARTLSAMEQAAQSRGRTTVNQFAHRSTLTGPADKGVTAPNNDTLYSSAWLDLRNGPVSLTIPPLPRRYHSVAVLDLFTDNQVVLGTRKNGESGGRYILVGPDWRGKKPRGTTLVRLPVNEAWVIVRVLVDGNSDLPAAVAAQKAFTLTASSPPARRPFQSAPPKAGDPSAFLDRVNEIMERGPMPPALAVQAHKLAEAGIRPGISGAFASLSPEMQTAWQSRMPKLETALREGMAHVGTRRNGWIYPAPGLGEFGKDWVYRSRIALGGLGALPAEEATYLTADADAGGVELNGVNLYRLRVPKGVPVDGFWSLTMYRMDEDGRTYFVANPLNRYSVGNRTAGLEPNSDGSIDILMSAALPKSGRANWLPAPDGPFRLSFRAYLPRQEFRNGTFTLPAIEKVP